MRMIVSSGSDRTYWRSDRSAKAVKNGSFIDLHYKDDGLNTWLAISIKELRVFLESEEKTGSVTVSFDEPANAATALREFRERRSTGDTN